MSKQAEITHEQSSIRSPRFSGPTFNSPCRISKAELPQEGILFHTQFPSLGIFINKKVGFQKN